jgi:plastocyanin
MKNYERSGKWILVLIMSLVVLLMVACSSYSAANNSTTIPPTTTLTMASPTTTPPASTVEITTPAVISSPTVQITGQGSGNIFGIGKVTITVEVHNFNLVNQLGKANTAGQGHLHYFMDVDAPTMVGQPAITAAGTYAATADASYTWNNVGGGHHMFSVELVNNDHTPLNPPVVESISVLVIPEIGPPGMVILSPRDNSAVQGDSVTISAQVSNFDLVDKLGQDNSAREGHLHYFIDVDAPTGAGQSAVTAAGTYAATAADSYTWQNVSAGKHTFSVELINNDHTPLNPPVVAKVTVTVAGTTTSTSPTSSATRAATPSAASNNQKVTINLIARGMAFDKPNISVPAGASVTIIFDNQDAGMPHNFSVYQNLAGGGTKPVFVGNVITGPASINYQFTAPAEQGSYFFECDVHPQKMNGSFVIEPPK